MSLARVLLRSRAMHTSARRLAITQFQMPAMSPTMTEGGIDAWKVKEGDHFSAGDVLLEIETDKATMDVEAQDDGVMGKIVVPDGSKNVPVGKVIALLAEEGDDIANLEAPKESAAPKPAPPQEEAKPAASTPPPSTSASPPSAPQPLSNHPFEIETAHPLFPSVHRLLEENNIHDTSKIKGTGIRGMLTKGDVLAYLGLASNPYGTFRGEAKAEKTVVKQVEAKKEVKAEAKPLDGFALRSLFAQGLANMGKPPPVAVHPAATFDDIIHSYMPKAPTPVPGIAVRAVPPTKRSKGYLDGLH
ncbi:single hybrid motif-containing protein [Calocera viscosa TUFC12733]|uniref:Single hybrid motif-containing protein n=1 Tax=Calocera viscosa (strain TUFC12733) TaxID=1330018 RepID=A0A167GB95_CALVF|nr:single hybrid motif-containing protein [Calocera viscosa TUFC12733]